jgi:hypothetical protein
VFKLSYLLSFCILVFLFGCGFNDANSSTNSAMTKQNQPGFSATGCNVRFDRNTNQIQLLSKITVGSGARTRCIIRLNSPNPQKRFRLVPLAFKGTVKKAPATVAISSILIGDKPTNVSKTYTSPTKFDLTNQIPKTNYTSTGKNVFGINLILMTKGGSLEITDMKFAIQ